MNKAALRWKGRISALRPFAMGGGLMGIIFLLSFLNNLVQATRAANSPMVEIGQLVNGEIGANQYVTISGLVVYGVGFDESDGSKRVAVFYPLIDVVTGDLIFVHFTQAELLNKEGEEMLTVSGRTASPYPELTKMILRTVGDINAAGLRTTLTLYIDNVLQPGLVNRLYLQIAGLGVILMLCAAVLTVPRIIFAPEPLTGSAAVYAGGLGLVQVTGKLNKVDPKKVVLETTNRRQYFSKANANIHKTETSGLMVHVHQVIIRRTMGIKTGQTEYDWVVRINPHQVLRVEPGKLYTFDQRWAVRIVYKDDRDKEMELVLSFENNQDQSAFINTLKALGFAIQWLGYVNTI